VRWWRRKRRKRMRRGWERDKENEGRLVRLKDDVEINYPMVLS
jgi:hypothetical protein